MFKCDTCKVTSQPGEKVSMRTVETRYKEYQGQGTYNEFGDWYVFDRGGAGNEIVREIRECSNCAKKAETVASA